MKKMILHMGADKTGTSALQSFFANNIQELSNNNFSYYYENQEILSNAKNYKVSDGNAQPLPKLVWINKGNFDKKLIEQTLDKHIDYANGKNILMSAEDFGALDPFGAVYINEYALKRGYQITAIYYVRAIIDHEMSRYQQFTKEATFIGDFTQWIDKKSNCSFLRVIKNISKVFGEKNLIVKNYDFNKKNLIENFLETVLNIQNITKFNITKKKVNRSLTDYELLLMKSFNKVLDTNDEAIFVSNSFVDNFKDAKTTYKITQNEFNLLKEKYANLVIKLNEFVDKNEEPIKLISNIEIVEHIEELELDIFQERMIALMAEIVKKVTK